MEERLNKSFLGYEGQEGTSGVGVKKERTTNPEDELSVWRYLT